MDMARGSSLRKTSRCNPIETAINNPRLVSNQISELLDRCFGKIPPPGRIAQIPSAHLQKWRAVRRTTRVEHDPVRLSHSKSRQPAFTPFLIHLEGLLEERVVVGRFLKRDDLLLPQHGFRALVHERL